MDHHCHAKRCVTPCKPEMLFCKKHWDRVPRVLQQDVWNTYRPGQCDDKQPSAEWHAAADAAIAYVAKAEAAGLGPREIELIQELGRGTGLMERVGSDQWKCTRRNERWPRADAMSYGTVTISRLSQKGLIERGRGSNVSAARISNAGIAWYVAPRKEEPVDQQG